MQADEVLDQLGLGHEAAVNDSLQVWAKPVRLGPLEVLRSPLAERLRHVEGRGH